MDRAVAMDPEFLAATKDEAGMLYWGFVRAGRGNKQFPEPFCVCKLLETALAPTAL